MTTSLQSNGIKFADNTVWESADQVDRIISTHTHATAAVLTKKGKIVVWTGNTSIYGSNGIGNDVRHMPMAITFPGNDNSTIVDAQVRILNGWALLSNGALYQWGYNGYGMCATANTSPQYSPTRGNINHTVAQVYKNHTSAYDASAGAMYMRRTDNTYWSVGYGATGRLGLGNTNNYNVWTQMPLTAGTVSNMWPLGNHRGLLFVQKTDNTIWACGNNMSGSIGNGNTTQQNSLIDVTAAWGGASPITQIIGSYNYGNGSAENANGWTCMLKANGEVWIAGVNEGMGDGTSTQKTTPIKIANAGSGVVELASSQAGSASAIYMRYANGTLVGFGRNSEGQLATGDTSNRLSPYTISTACTAILTKLTGTEHYSWRVPFIWSENGITKGTGWNQYYHLALTDPTLNSSQRNVPTTLNQLHGLVEMSTCGYSDGWWHLGIVESIHTDAGGNQYKKRNLIGWGYNGRYNLNPYQAGSHAAGPITYMLPS